ncbi:MAG TPA: helix-turn-helix domain-containing protein [Nocardioides sp.]
MTRSAAGNARTYMPDNDQASIEDFVRVLREGGLDTATARPALVAADGHTHELPPAVFDILLQVVGALADGNGVTVIPLNAMLTTQQAAEFLGISRPTLVRLLDTGQIPMHKPGRHRLVALPDLVSYQEAVRSTRREALDELVADAEMDGLYATTDGQVPRIR